MTLEQIFKWIEDTPGQHHAIGRYQFIPSTLADLQRRTGLGPSTRFNRATQDALANILIYDAGFARFQTGALSRYDFMTNLARIWAGLPLSNGRSAYHGYAGNKATITRNAYETYMAQIFPVNPRNPD
jgi:muramidase (phage lysozyme)